MKEIINNKVLYIDFLQNIMYNHVNKYKYIIVNLKIQIRNEA